MIKVCSHTDSKQRVGVVSETETTFSVTVKIFYSFSQPCFCMLSVQQLTKRGNMFLQNIDGCLVERVLGGHILENFG